ncbi:hypothetical protein XELAEV_18028343mg [Xenopus laevis]|uniref:Uncharacterized protein n=1 Tax=Xenopus laevis TaxID=8355 RepID=A0A974CZ85_XENLA|nr:hypothetical protein XELAEV_18028343mg [Xenopus laevis]
MENEPGTSHKTANSQGETSTNEAEKSQTSDTIDSTTSANAMPSSKKRNKKKKHTCDCDIHLTEVKEIIQKVDNKVDFLLQKMEPLLKVSFVIQQDVEQQSQV